MTYRNTNSPRISGHAKRARDRMHGTLPARKQPALSALAIGDLSVNVCGLEDACACGYVLCSKRGPCAPAIDAGFNDAPHVPVEPMPTCVTCGRRKVVMLGTGECGSCCVGRVMGPGPAPEVSDPWAVGMRVVCVNEGSGAYVTKGSVYTIAGHAPANMLQLEGVSEDGEPANLWRYRFEPAPLPQPVQAGWVPPAPWVVDSEGDWGLGARYMEAAAKVRVAKNETAGNVTWFNDTDGHKSGDAPTLAQGACAALSIQLIACSCITPSCTNHKAYLDGEALAFGETAETCARAALEAHAKLGAGR